MRVITLRAENVKKIRAIEITPKGDIVTITGKNGSGKTSTLDCLWWAIAGASNIQSQPIRKGETKARIRLDLGELVVERRFTESGSQLFVENAQGARFPSPQRMLDDLLGALSFDPLAFARMEPRKQFDELRRIAKLEVDLDQLDGLNRADYARRTDLNRDARAKRAQAEAIVVVADLPTAPIDEGALITELQEAGERNRLIDRAKAQREQTQRDANSKKADGVSLRERSAKQREDAQAAYTRAGEEAAAAYKRAQDVAAAQLKDALDEADALDTQASEALAVAAELEQKIDSAKALPEPANVADIRVKLEHAKQVNAKLVTRDRRRDLEQEAANLDSSAKALTEQMEAREKAKQDAIAAAAMPVEGLGFGEGVVLYNGVPFDQASTAEQLRVSLAIAMAGNPKLRVIRIQDGSLLDDDSLASIAQMAKDGEYQVWIEKVDASGKIGIVIDDGAVVAVDGKPVEPAAEATA